MRRPEAANIMAALLAAAGRGVTHRVGPTLATVRCDVPVGRRKPVRDCVLMRWNQFLHACARRTEVERQCASERLGVGGDPFLSRKSIGVDSAFDGKHIWHKRV